MGGSPCSASSPWPSLSMSKVDPSCPSKQHVTSGECRCLFFLNLNHAIASNVLQIYDDGEDVLYILGVV